MRAAAAAAAAAAAGMGAAAPSFGDGCTLGWRSASRRKRTAAARWAPLRWEAFAWRFLAWCLGKEGGGEEEVAAVAHP